jgi:hypothetical protein
MNVKMERNRCFKLITAACEEAGDQRECEEGVQDSESAEPQVRVVVPFQKTCGVVVRWAGREVEGGGGGGKGETTCS